MHNTKVLSPLAVSVAQPVGRQVNGTSYIKLAVSLARRCLYTQSSITEPNCTSWPAL